MIVLVKEKFLDSVFLNLFLSIKVECSSTKPDVLDSCFARNIRALATGSKFYGLENAPEVPSIGMNKNAEITKAKAVEI